MSAFILSGTRNSLAAILLMLAILSLPRSGGVGIAAPPKAMVRQVYLMGTRCTLTLFSGDLDLAMKQLESLIRTLECAESELSTWRIDSALSRLNQQPVGVPFELAQPLCRLFEKLLYWSQATGDTFDPAIGALLEAWGVRAGARLPSNAELKDARNRSGMRYYRINPPACRITKSREVTIDCGAFGKGEALDRLLTLTGADPWLVDLGGQVLVRGLPPGQMGWPVAIAHPERRDETLFSIRLTSGSLATSAGSERDLEVNGRRVGHILDPRTGRPAEFKGSVSVWHEKALRADILSTALYVMGPEEGLAWADTRGLAACFLVPGAESGVEVRASRAFSRRFLSQAGIPVQSSKLRLQDLGPFNK